LVSSGCIYDQILLRTERPVFQQGEKVLLAITQTPFFQAQKILPKYAQAMRILTTFFTAAFPKTAPRSSKANPAPAKP